MRQARPVLRELTEILSVRHACQGDLTVYEEICKLGTLPQNLAERLDEVRARTLRTQQRVTYQYQYPVRGLGLRTYATAEIPLVDKMQEIASFVRRNQLKHLWRV